MFGPLDYEIQPLDKLSYIFFQTGLMKFLCIAKLGIFMLKIYVETSHECVRTFCWNLRFVTIT